MKHRTGRIYTLWLRCVNKLWKRSNSSSDKECSPIKKAVVSPAYCSLNIYVALGQKLSSLVLRVAQPLWRMRQPDLLLKLFYERAQLLARFRVYQLAGRAGLGLSPLSDARGRARMLYFFRNALLASGIQELVFLFPTTR
jgi:hypothetical protein